MVRIKKKGFAHMKSRRRIPLWTASNLGITQALEHSVLA